MTTGSRRKSTSLSPAAANLIATVKGSEPGPSLMLNTHMDVVPPGSGWTHGALFGNGA